VTTDYADLADGEPSAAEARRMLRQQLATWLADGKREFSPRDLHPLLERIGRGRSWFYNARDELIAAGAIAEGSEPGTYAILAPDAPDAPAAPRFRITAITFDDREQLEAVTALAGGPCLDFIASAAPAVAGGGSTVTLARAGLLALYQAAGQIPGTDPRHAGSLPVWESLNWVYCSLIDGDD
jgi:hypothetical protein